MSGRYWKNKNVWISILSTNAPEIKFAKDHQQIQSKSWNCKKKNLTSCTSQECSQNIINWLVLNPHLVATLCSSFEPGSKLLVLGMVIQPLIGNPYNGYINPYYWVDDHPLLYGNNGSLDPGTFRENGHPGSWMLRTHSPVFGCFWGWGFPYIGRIHTAYIGEYLYFRYLKCLVMRWTLPIKLIYRRKHVATVSGFCLFETTASPTSPHSPKTNSSTIQEKNLVM